MVAEIYSGVMIKKGQPGARKLPHTQGPGRGPTIFGVLYTALPCFLHKRLFSGLEPVTFQSRGCILV